MNRCLILFAFISLPLTAQELPFKPEPAIKIKLTCGRDIPCQERYHVDRKTTWQEQFRVDHRTADWKWDAFTIASIGLTIADVENSIYVLRSSSAVELDPIYGAHPGRLRYYSICAPIAVAAAYYSWRWKREDDALRDAGLPQHDWHKWWLPGAINAGSHLVGVLATVALTGK